MAACGSPEFLTVRTREDVPQSHTMTTDEESKRRVMSGGSCVSVMQTADLRNCDHAAVLNPVNLAFHG